MINEDELKLAALENAEQNGIVFIDEIDKVAKRQETSGADVSREGRAARPAAAGRGLHRFDQGRHDQNRPYPVYRLGRFSPVQTQRPDSRAAGRLPIRVELAALTVDDFVRILREPNASLTEQYTALMETEGVSLEFTDDGLARIAEVAWQVNEKQENIGARRLHTVMERLLETISFEASDMTSQTVTRSTPITSTSNSASCRSTKTCHNTSLMKPTEIKLHKQSRVLEISFEDGSTFKLPTEYLRVYSPSAEVRGHGPGQEVLQIGKEDVAINDIEPIGHYAIKLVFDDNHDSGIYSWDYLYELAQPTTIAGRTISTASTRPDTLTTTRRPKHGYDFRLYSRQSFDSWHEYSGMLRPQSGMVA